MIGRAQPPAAVEPDQPRGFDAYDVRLGDIMRGERATLGKSLLDVQRELKIKAAYIAAIENADPSVFETPGFVAGYVRSYARYLGMDPEWAYAQFCQEGSFSAVHGMSPEASGSRPDTAPRRTIKVDPLADPNASFVPRGEALLSGVEPGAIGSFLVLVALIVALGFGGWTALREIQQVQLTPVDQAPGVTAEVDPLETASLEDDTTGAVAPPVLPEEDRIGRLYRPRELDVPVMEARDQPISTLDPRSVGVFAQTTPPLADAPLAPAQTDSAPASTAKPVQVVENALPDLVIVAANPAWVRVRDAGGNVVFEKIMDKGESYVVPKLDSAPILRAGNSGSVFFVLNGDTYGPAAPGAQVAKNIVLDADSLKANYALADLETDTSLATMVAQLRTTLTGAADPQKDP